MDVNHIFQKPWVIPTAVGVAAAGAGFGVGYILGKKAEHNAMLERIMTQTASYVAARQEDAEFEEDDELEALPQPDEDLIDEAYSMSEPPEEPDEEPPVEPEEDEVEPVTVIRNVFEGLPDDQWVYEDELSAREGKEMYVIHHDEFMGNEQDYNQETLTFYAGDDIVADQEDKPIYNYSGLMGDLKFGHGSGDVNVVYIRNDVIRMEWEVLKSEGSFETEVLGLQVEQEYEEADLKHSGERRFRPD